MEIINYSDDRGRMGIFKNVDKGNIQEVLLCQNHKNTLKGFHCTPYSKTIYLLEGEIEDRYFDHRTLEMKTFHLKAGDHITIPKYAYHGYFCKTDIVLLYLLDGKFDQLYEKTLSPTYGLKLNDGKYNGWLNTDYDVDYIISEKDSKSEDKIKVDYLLIGHNGFLGSYVHKLLEEQEKSFVVYPGRVENHELLQNYIEFCQPLYLIYAAGVAGKPNIDWCVDNPEETVYQNVTLVMNVVDYCNRRKIKVCVFGSGFVFQSPDSNGIEVNENTKPTEVTEETIPNYSGHIYCRLRIQLEQLLSVYSNVLYLRIIYPILDGKHEKCFLHKIAKFAKLDGVYNIPAKCTVIKSLFPLLFGLIENNECIGILNFVNNGTMKLPEIAQSYYNMNKDTSSVKVKEVVMHGSHNRPVCLLDITKLKNFVGEVEDLNDLIEEIAKSN